MNVCIYKCVCETFIMFTDWNKKWLDVNDLFYNVTQAATLLQYDHILVDSISMFYLALASRSEGHIRGKAHYTSYTVIDCNLSELKHKHMRLAKFACSIIFHILQVKDSSQCFNSRMYGNWKCFLWPDRESKGLHIWTVFDGLSPQNMLLITAKLLNPLHSAADKGVLWIILIKLHFWHIK